VIPVYHILIADAMGRTSLPNQKGVNTVFNGGGTMKQLIVFSIFALLTGANALGDSIVRVTHPVIHGYWYYALQVGEGSKYPLIHDAAQALINKCGSENLDKNTDYVLGESWPSEIKYWGASTTHFYDIKPGPGCQ
jgi:hypothetical protein